MLAVLAILNVLILFNNCFKVKETPTYTWKVKKGQVLTSNIVEHHICRSPSQDINLYQLRFSTLSTSMNFYLNN